MLPMVWEMPSLELSTFTLHSYPISGAAINWAIINGETKTGCYYFKIDTLVP
jgi:hypothetical protein